jgi:hypothetical protein
MAATSSESSFPLGFSDDDRAQFIDLIMVAFRVRSIEVAGDVPDLIVNGGLLNVRNLAASCDRLGRSDWPAEIERFVEAVASQMDHLQLSADVARLSLRLRLLVDDGQFPDLVTKPSLPGLSVALFVRRPNMGQSVTAEMLDGWAIPIDEAFELARLNTWDHERGELVEYPDMAVLQGDSLFTSTGVLHLDEWFTAGSYAEAMSVIGGLAQFVDEMMEAGPGSTSAQVWFVEPGGSGLGGFGESGRFGEGAEPVSIDVIETGDLGPRLEISVGPKLADALERLGRAPRSR